MKPSFWKETSIITHVLCVAFQSVHMHTLSTEFFLKNTFSNMLNSKKNLVLFNLWARKQNFTYLRMQTIPKPSFLPTHRVKGEETPQGWSNGIVGKAAKCSAAIPYGCWFQNQLRPLQSRPLLMAWQSSRRWHKCLGLFTHMKVPESFQLMASKWASSSCCGYLGSEPAGRHLLTLPFK